MESSQSYKDATSQDEKLSGNDPGSGESSGSRSPFSQLSTFFRGSSIVRSSKDGQPPKRRGPKPDSKPALTRRQELNRQAQRTHRERKELYIKALEQEVLKLKEVWQQAVRDNDVLREENRKLRAVLAQHGIQLDLLNLSASSGGVSGGFPLTVPSADPHSSSCAYGAPALQQQSNGHLGGMQAGSSLQSIPGGVDYDQVGIDFVLALEKPCMDHTQMLCVRAQAEDGDAGGHALLLSTPPRQHLIERPDVPHPHQAPDIGAGDLLKLLDLSNRLPLDGEITPVMAWAKILGDARFMQLSVGELTVIRESLLTKVRCYGFGAVLEEFELSDAIDNAMNNKGQLPPGEATISPSLLQKK